jgi:hypothetical protein
MNPFTPFGLAAIAGAVTLAAWTPAFASAPSDLRRPLNVDAALVSFDFVDLGQPGVTAGDSFVQADTLSVDGRPVGSDLFHCVAAGDETAAGLCDAVLVLGDATITAAGRIPNFEPADGQPFRFAITGGTNRYRRAAGEIIVTETATGYTAIVDVQI